MSIGTGRFGSQFPVPGRKYQTVHIRPGKGKKGQRTRLKVESFTNRYGTLDQQLRKVPRKQRKVVAEAMGNVLRHKGEQSILATERGQFPVLPKVAWIDTEMPRQSVPVPVYSGSGGKLDIRLLNPFIVTDFSKKVDNRHTSTENILTYEQPLNGAEVVRKQIFYPDPAHGGTEVRYDF